MYLSYKVSLQREEEEESLESGCEGRGERWWQGICVCVCVWSVCGCEERGVVARHMCVMGVEVTECVCVWGGYIDVKMFVWEPTGRELAKIWT